MTSLVKFDQDEAPHWVVRRRAGLYVLPVELPEVLATPLLYARFIYESAKAKSLVLRPPMFAPVPELFLKTTPARLMPDTDAVGIRKDAGWDVPESDVSLVVNTSAKTFGYLICHDACSRFIDNDDRLYLGEAKPYTRSCSLNSQSIHSCEVSDPTFPVAALLERYGEKVYPTDTSTATTHRGFPGLDWLLRTVHFLAGVVPLTGTRPMPEYRSSLQGGDVITITLTGLGARSNPVAVVGR